MAIDHMHVLVVSSFCFFLFFILYMIQHELLVVRLVILVRIAELFFPSIVYTNGLLYTYEWTSLQLKHTPYTQTKNAVKTVLGVAH